LAPVTVEVHEDDEAGLMFKRSDNPRIPLNSQNGLAVTSGEVKSYLVKLKSDPIHNVTVRPLGSALVTFSPPTLTFTGGQNGNWNIPQTVTIFGASPGTGNIYHSLSFPGATSTIYESLNFIDRFERGPSLPVVVTSGPNGGTTGPTLLTLSDTALTLDEDEQTSYLVSLASRPSGDVMLMPMSWNTDIAQVSGTLTFTPSNWNQPQRVTVTGINDNLVNDPAQRMTSISHSLSPVPRRSPLQPCGNIGIAMTTTWSQRCPTNR